MRCNFDKVEAKLALIWPLLGAVDLPVCQALTESVAVAACERRPPPAARATHADRGARTERLWGRSGRVHQERP